jgi:lipoprotein-releasing system ATP-binding protein
MNEAQLAEFRNRHLGFVFQEHHLLPQLTALENVVVPSVPLGRGGNGATDRARALLHRVGLAERADHRPGHLSGGERQRVAVARALMNGPRILLADEPTGSLDQANAATIGQLLLELQREHGLALICVTHNDELAAQFDRQVRLEAGRFVELARSPQV